MVEGKAQVKPIVHFCILHTAKFDYYNVASPYNQSTDHHTLRCHVQEIRSAQPVDDTRDG